MTKQTRVRVPDRVLVRRTSFRTWRHEGCRQRAAPRSLRPCYPIGTAERRLPEQGSIWTFQIWSTWKEWRIIYNQRYAQRKAWNHSLQGVNIKISFSNYSLFCVNRFIWGNSQRIFYWRLSAVDWPPSSSCCSLGQLLYRKIWRTEYDWLQLRRSLVNCRSNANLLWITMKYSC